MYLCQPFYALIFNFFLIIDIIICFKKIKNRSVTLFIAAKRFRNYVLSDNKIVYRPLYYFFFCLIYWICGLFFVRKNATFTDDILCKVIYYVTIIFLLAKTKKFRLYPVRVLVFCRECILDEFFLEQAMQTYFFYRAVF